MSIDKNSSLNKLKQFKEQTKFIEETDKIFYPGISDPSIKEQLTDLINKSADDFSHTVKTNPTENNFRENIKIGLARITESGLQLDSEDEERVGKYYEELMDCVGLKSSEGIINDWVYGFNPGSK
ncbi:uncharacterized protein DUF4844 [Mucilaginibacter yixingensis]|uniref:Uncharacterized protein DUF4844 n=1 Tax=Mucilaginibacter yixingensis TaxID=1295612 RepID=A0A2T5JAS2_9SPHI|nr:DUF4844 domain-containing protein [Mucilaginibacter yixingensis]PTQ97958.1 uncharacterized protein DUF4844 [Mucilaginibacter yixingensis]